MKNKTQSHKSPQTKHIIPASLTAKGDDRCDKTADTSKSRELKLFVWEGEDVLTDDTNGMVCVLAHNFEEAIKLIKEKGSHYLENMPITNYKIITEPEAFICFGGG